MSKSHNVTLSSKELLHLRRAHRRTRSKRKSYRLNAVVLLGQGWTYVDVAKALLIDVSTLRNYVHRYKQKGIVGLLSDDYECNANKLTDAEMRQLDMHLQEVTYRRVDDIIAYIELEFDVKYSRSGLTNLLHNLGFSYKKPRKVPGKANRSAQKQFLEKYKKIRKNMGPNDRLLFVDGAHPQHNPLVMPGWIKRGESKNIYTNTRYHRINVLGALDVDSYHLVSQLSNVLNEESSLDFLEKIRSVYPSEKIYLVLDNAGYFTTKKFKRYAEAMAIELVYLPAYSPNLNLIERVWLYFQKHILYNRYYPTFDEFKRSCLSFFKKFDQYHDDLQSVLTENFEIIGT